MFVFFVFFAQKHPINCSFRMQRLRFETDHDESISGNSLLEVFWFVRHLRLWKYEHKCVDVIVISSLTEKIGNVRASAKKTSLKVMREVFLILDTDLGSEFRKRNMYTVFC